MSLEVPYNPLDRIHLAESVTRALLQRSAQPLGEVERFVGSGIYAIYYKGPHPLYASIAAKNQNGFDAPIYCGKAITKGGRKGRGRLDSSAQTGPALFDRLKEHAESITAVETYALAADKTAFIPEGLDTIPPDVPADQALRLSDFHCRFITVDDVWIPLGETLMIATYSPIWNLHLDGFGNHDPGKGRYKGKRPPWDVLHPGRSWAFKCAENKTPVEFWDKVTAALVASPELDREDEDIEDDDESEGE